MKKLLHVLMCFMLLFSACTSEDEKDGLNLPSEKKEKDYRFYGVKYPEGELNTKGVAQRNNLWYPGTTIKVKFLGNPNSVFADKVKQYASEWTEHADINFDFVASGDADVRVGFDWDSRYVTWSYTGTDCKKISNQNEATVNFADWDYLSEEEIKGDVLRAFGQVLGLELEHRHLDSGISWRRDMETYWQNELGDIAWSELKKYVFDALDNVPTDGLIATDGYDENSIMVWPFPRNYTNGVSNYANYELSELDIELIGKIYPKKNIVLLHMLSDERDASKARLNITNSKTVTINWGDGTETIATKGDSVEYTHSYADQSMYEIKVYGSKDAITKLDIERNWSKSINISNNEELKVLKCYANQLSSIDISNNRKLERFYCEKNSLSELDLTKNAELKILNCTGNTLTQLDLSNNQKLMNLDCSANNFIQLSFPQNAQMEHLNCSYNQQLIHLDISNNGNLKQLVCGYSQLSELNVANNVKLNYLSCDNSPLISDREALIYLAESLPVADNGIMIIYDTISASWVQDILSIKGWTIKQW